MCIRDRSQGGHGVEVSWPSQYLGADTTACIETNVLGVENTSPLSPWCLRSLIMAFYLSSVSDETAASNYTNYYPNVSAYDWWRVLNGDDMRWA